MNAVTAIVAGFPNQTEGRDRVATPPWRLNLASCIRLPQHKKVHGHMKNGDHPLCKRKEIYSSTGETLLS